MKLITLLLSLLALALASGCVGTPRPIKTELGITANASGIPQLDYSSEKDVLYKRTSTHPETGILEQVEFRAEASSAARAQAERESVTAQASLAQAQALSVAVQALGNNATSVLEGQPSPSPSSDFDRARAGLPLLRATE